MSATTTAQPAAEDDSVASPRRAASLVSRRRPLASPAEQLRLLASLDLEVADFDFDFDAAVRGAGARDGLRAGRVEVFQINVGKLCNMTCAHCHVDAGPDRVAENMDRATIDLCLAAIERLAAPTVDVTGGAPELNPSFRYLVDESVARGRHVVDRCNLSVLLLPRFADLPEWLGARGVEMACSLPSDRPVNTDAQRGEGAWHKSLEALRRLNAAGYGKGDPRRRLTLVANPVGAFLAPPQGALERDWRRSLARHDVTFDRVIALNNMPISRFLDWLDESGNLAPYVRRLAGAFNPATVDGLMCRNTISISWDGRVFDCDFNQMLDLEADGGGAPLHVRDLDAARLAGRAIRTARHCFGCTAGAGSSCAGAIA